MKDRNKFRTLSTTDYLTGAYNRTKFMEYANYELERSKRYKSTFSILLMDLDLFKKLNDTYGHNIGDEVLKNFGSILKESFTIEDIVGRAGGDEFIVFVKDIQEHGNAINRAQEICQKIRNIEILWKYLLFYLESGFSHTIFVISF